MKEWIFIFVLCPLFGCATTPAISKNSDPEMHQELVARLDSPGDKVEIYWSAPANKNRKLPAVVYIHGVQDATRPGALNFVNGGLLKSTADLGYISVGMSMPGYGQSSGEADFCGRGTQDALRSVIASLKLRTDVDQDRIYISGISCGATVAAMIADKVQVAGMVLISGVYNFEDMHKKWHTSEWTLEPSVINYIDSCVFVEGGLKKASIRRSALANTTHFKEPVLLIAGGKDRIVDDKQSITMHAALRKNGKNVELILNPDGAHMISYDDWVAYVNSFAHKTSKN